jgi:hypothetical protein
MVVSFYVLLIIRCDYVICSSNQQTDHPEHSLYRVSLTLCIPQKQTDMPTHKQIWDWSDERVIMTGDPLPSPQNNTVIAIDNQYVISLESGEIDPYLYDDDFSKSK